MIRRIRQPFLLAALAGILSLSGCCDKNPDTTAESSSAPLATPTPEKFTLLVGTYTEGPASYGKSKGIPVFRFDTTTGEAVKIADNDGIRNPSWLVVSGDAKRVYSVNELNGTGKSGEVSAFDFDAHTGRLLFINKVSSEGDDPCHLLLDEATNLLFVSNYTGGNMVALPVAPDTERALLPASPATPLLNAPTISPKPGSHIHSAVKIPVGAWLVVQDLGLNTVAMYPYEPAYLTHCVERPTRPATLLIPSGTGPRHLIFDTRGAHAYVIGEQNDTVTVLNNGLGYAEWKDSPLSPAQIVHLGAPVEPGKGTAAAIHLSDDGRFLYASTRNPKNILVVFAVNPADGTLREIQTVSSGGLAPREFTIAPGGKFLLVANQQSDAIAVFSRDPETGKITDTGRRIPVGSPTDLKWAPAK